MLLQRARKSVQTAANQSFNESLRRTIDFQARKNKSNIIQNQVISRKKNIRVICVFREMAFFLLFRNAQYHEQAVFQTISIKSRAVFCSLTPLRRLEVETPLQKTTNNYYAWENISTEGYDESDFAFYASRLQCYDLHSCRDAIIIPTSKDHNQVALLHSFYLLLPTLPSPPTE